MAQVLRVVDIPAGAKRQAIMDYLGEIKGAAWAWGSMDCAHAAAGWIGRARGFDAARDLPRYHSLEEAEAVIAQNGGLAAMAQLAMATWGLPLASPPADGDVGLLGTQPRVTTIGGGALAIFAGGLWISKVDRGLYGRRGPALMSWRV